ncbi:hypothetical protein LAC1533_0076 [Ligilactobacillus acidipiscis]|uniref:Uncharacterized protein n=1 Tax=Ligilactobacillus acidipiscis TaxID=89059 RepID=A0A1K1KKW4_9LACO|nr:hypothetical protein LAC1533_0076 [Ligilactobacillus acidipiscis]
MFSDWCWSKEMFAQRKIGHVLKSVSLSVSCVSISLESFGR